MNLRLAGTFAIAVGIGALLLVLLADAVGVGGQPGTFGAKQKLGLFVALLLVAGGFACRRFGTRTLELWSGAVLMLVSGAFSFGAAEALARLDAAAWPFQAPMEVPDHLAEKDASLRWLFSPGAGRNSLGLRNREIGPKDGQTRILVLGDSLVWSGETSSKKLYTEVVQDELNERGERRIEVVNGGIPGYTTYQELEFLRLHGREIDADVVVLGFVFSDVYYKYLHRPERGSLLSIDPESGLQHFDPTSLPGSLLRRSYALHWAFHRGELLWRRMRGEPVFPFERTPDFYLAWKPARLGPHREPLGRDA